MNIFFRHFFHLKKKCLVGVQENRGGVKAILTKSKCEQIILGDGFTKLSIFIEQDKDKNPTIY